ncbi:MAG: heme lyase CcmF/NrfE family subunit [Chloroflexota bacterium]
MLADLGFSTLVISFGVALYAIVAAWWGSRQERPHLIESARNAIIITFPLLFIACAILVMLLIQGDFSVRYVWRVSSIETPTYLKFTALWGGQAGSLLFWNFILAAFMAVAVASKWRDHKELMPYAIIMGAITQVFFIGLSAFIENPFARLDVVPPDGNGLNPLLRHPGMIIHPPMLYLGFIGFIVPYVFAMAALISGKLDDDWIHTTRRWTLVAWLFLSLGLILGGRWAYDVLGWGGYWAWDPVENASFMPWLAGTAFLHSVMIQEQRKMFKMWNMFLVILTYCLVILGTFIVRTGIISSVHSFARSDIGPYFFVFIVFIFTFSGYWVNKRRDELRSTNELTSFLSREAAFLYNNFVILAILAVVFLFTYYPIISELFTGEKGFVGPTVYEQALAPLFAVLVLLMGVAPLTMWYRTSAKRLEMALRWPAAAAAIFTVLLFALGIGSVGALIGLFIVSFSTILTVLEFWKGTRARMKRWGENAWVAFSTLMARNRRRYGGYWIHLGVLIMGVGIIGVEIFQQETQIRLFAGESISLGDYTMVFNGVERFAGPDDLVITQATADLYNNGRFVKTLIPQTELYTRTNQPMSIPDLRATISEDFYVLLINWEPTAADAATFRVYLNPLINWVWAGGFIFVFGTLIAAWPDGRKEKTAVRQPRRITVGAAAD